VKKLFSVDGKLLIGKAHKGKLWSALPDHYVDWASDEIEGFHAQWLELNTHGPAPLPESKPKRAPGRIYTLDATPRKYNPPYPDHARRT